MKTKLVFVLCLFSVAALAGPDRPIQSSSFLAQTPCGPAHDPLALQGQWFLDPGTGATNVNVREYHDEDNARSIYGRVQNIVFADPTDPNSNIMAFEILATVSNTLPSSFQAGSASNSHNEVQTAAGVFPGGSTMADVRITAEFALVNQGVTPSGQPPYWGDPLSGGAYHIVALNAHEHGWYCWDPNQQNPQFQPAGAYQVPAWNLTPSTIPPGGTATVLMQFMVTGAGIPNNMSDYRHGVLRYSQNTGEDVLYNRTPSLKISHWLDTIVCDNGVTLTTPPFPYWDGEPIEYIHASDASVFFNDNESDLDFGDAPDQPYPTWLASNGARHNILQGAPYFDDGTQNDQPDPEPDGQPTPLADGDDLNGGKPDDEDGIIFTTPLIPGQNATVNITVAGGAGGGFVDAWIDFNGDGAWATPGERIQNGWLPAGANTVNFTVPASAVIGQTYGRFRINSQAAGLAPTGAAIDGEVEDHTVDIDEEAQEEFDWGDIVDSGNFPAFTYRTLAANSGANHLIVSGVLMGNSIDSESDGQPNAAATGDDNDGNDDEDGVVFQSKLIPGQQAKIDVTVSVAGWLDVWLDADNSGDWTGPNDHIFSGNVVIGLNTITPTLPQGIQGGQNYMRFRFNTVGALPFNGGAPNGEVEDYAIHIEPLDWGDAPVGFNTLSANNGAHHTMSGAFLGMLIDAELDGQPSPNALGDGPDEDGVVFPSPIIPGQSAQFHVTVSAPGWVDVWLDVDMSGTWTGPDKIWGGTVTAGLNPLAIQIPYFAVPGQSYMRFRYNTAGAPLPVGGFGADGEVEDYQVFVEQPQLDFGDADVSYLTLLPNGAHHIITAGIQLGSQVDAESDGQPTPDASGDGADEDGVTFVGKVVASSNGTVNVVAGSSGGQLDAWIDFGNDGSFLGDHLWSGTSQTLASGLNGLTFAVPQPSALGPVAARFRISSSGGLPPDNVAIPTPDGEVEDYMVDLYQPAPTNLVITNISFNVSNTVTMVEWTAESNLTYQAQSSTNLMTNVWTDVGGWLLGPVNWQTNSAAHTQQFYRVTVPWSE